MKITLKRLSLGIASAGLLTIYGCGDSSTTTGGSTTPTTLTGVAATGAAFTDAIITVTDSKGVVVGTSAVIGADGTYSITLLSGAVAPLVLTASRTTADGAVESLISVMPASSTATATVNITPVTNLIASRLSSSGDPTKLAAELAAGTSIINATTVAATVQDVQTILAPILAATSTTATDPLNGTFATNGTGYDRLLDSLKVTITPASSTASNVEIGIKQQLAEEAPPTAIQFTSGTGQTAVASVPAIPAITPSSLIPLGTSALIAAHLAQLNTCFALPLSARITSGGTTAADIQAAECKNAFFSNNPALFKSNGKVVGLGKAFNGIFVDGGTGTVFSQGTYEFTRGNSDIVIGYKSKDTAGNETFDTFAVRLDTTDGKLKQIGNQFNYPGGVTAYHQLRDFVNQAASTYYSTGYNFNVPLISGITYVTVTTPKGNTLTLLPGSDGMVLPNQNGTPSGTTFVRIRSEYANTTLSPTPAHPSTRESGLVFSATDSTDTEISSFANQSVWTFTYYAGNVSSGTQQGVQHYKTRTRALTIAELRTQKLANLAAASIPALQVSPTVNTATAPNNNSHTALPTGAYVTPTWEVPTGALPPTQIKLFGNTRKTLASAITLANPNGFVLTSPNVAPNYDKTSFNDGLGVGSTTLTATIPCANGNGEVHCLTSPSIGYQTYAWMTGVHLWARDVAGREFVHFYSTQTLP